MDFAKYIKDDTLIVPYYFRTNITTDKYISALVSFLQSNTHITRLNLGSNKIGDEGAIALAQLSNLKHLNLSHNEIGAKGAIALAELKNLTSLDLTCNKIGDEGATALAQLSNLEQLNLHGGKVGDKGAIPLANLSNLEQLNLLCNKIGDEGAIALAQLSNLKHLNLHGGKVSDKGAKALAKLLNLKSLDLYSNKIGDIGNEGATALAQLSNLEYLDLGCHKIGDEGAKALIRLSKLKYLGLSSNKIGVKGAKALAQLSSLKRLNLCSNKIGYEGAKALAESEEHFELIDKLDGVSENSPLSFCERLKELWSQARAKSNGDAGKLDEDTTKRLFFDLARQNHHRERIELLLNDPDKYPFLINSRDEEGHTLAHFYNHSPEMQKFLFEHGMIPEQERNQRGDDARIARDSQSVHASPIIKRTNFFTRKLVESMEASKEQLERAAVSYVGNIGLLKQYQNQNDSIKLRLLSLTDNEKGSVMEKTLRETDPIPGDEEFIKTVIDKAEQALKQQYLKKNSRGEYDQGYPIQELQYDYTRDDAKITIPESIGYIKLLIDNFSVPLKEKKELLVTLMEQNPDLVKNKLSKVKEKLGNSVILDKEQFDKAELHGLLNGIDDGKKVDELFKEISCLNIEEVWREQKEFVFLKQIYIAATTYGESSSACIQGTWIQIISSINEISSEIVAQYDRYLEEEQKQEMQKNAITKENIKPFLEGLADKLIQYVELNPELKETLEDFVVGIVDIDKPEEITFEQQKILAEINKYFSENIKDALRNYNRNMPNRDEYGPVVEGLLEVKAMQRFVQPDQELLNHQENITGEMETQIDGDDRDEWFDAKDNDSCVNSSESDTDEEFKDANESVSPEESNTLLVLERLQSENSVEALATDQKIGIQNNNQQPSKPNAAAPRSEKRTIIAASVLAIAGVALGITIAVYLEMLAVGVAVGVCCLIAAAIIYCCNQPSKSLENSKVQRFSENVPQPSL